MRLQPFYRERIELIEFCKGYARSLGLKTRGIFTEFRIDPNKGCSKCSENTPHSNFCIHCGAPLKAGLKHMLTIKSPKNDVRILEFDDCFKFKNSPTGLDIFSYTPQAEPSHILEKALLDCHVGRIAGIICHEIWHANLDLRWHGKKQKNVSMIGESSAMAMYTKGAIDVIGLRYGKHSSEYKETERHVQELEKFQRLVKGVAEEMKLAYAGGFADKRKIINKYGNLQPDTVYLWVSGYKGLQSLENNAFLAHHYQWCGLYPLAKSILKQKGVKQSLPIFKDAIRIVINSNLIKATEYLLQFSPELEDLKSSLFEV